ncbi:hypothetical protein SPI_00805 [Niveomyces insectorum RCEF 264]|uniref:Uncharacterized protein n=1 Tax=Niveomyces insectorum RCEF 264 TaxID=1081102 RepID=A0A168ADR0_9HYPO|nr:hypothetical protein SPI_00805 [Niveomyces insectorum RCEF 264]
MTTAAAPSSPGVAETAGPAEPAEGAQRARYRRWLKHIDVGCVQRCLLFAVAILELLAILIIILLNAGGQQSDKGDVTAPDTYFLRWTDPVQVDTNRGNNQTEPFTLYWFLNGMCVEGGGKALRVLSRVPGANFHWRTFDSELDSYMAANYVCDNATTYYNIDSNMTAATTTTSSSTTLPAPTATTATSVVHIHADRNRNRSSSSNKTKTRCKVPSLFDTEDDDPPYVLTGQPSFGRASFVLYIFDVALTGAAWPWFLWLGGSSLRGHQARWQRRSCKLLAGTKAVATALNTVAAALLAHGVNWVVRNTAHPPLESENDGVNSNGTTASRLPAVASAANNGSSLGLTRGGSRSSSGVVAVLTDQLRSSIPDASSTSNATNESVLPPIHPGSVAARLVWVAVASQVLACLLFVVACFLLPYLARCRAARQRNGRSGVDAAGRRGRQGTTAPGMRQRLGSLPVYRPRDSGAVMRRNGDGEADGDDDVESLPPYQRNDPMGEPPRIPGYTYTRTNSSCNTVENARELPGASLLLLSVPFFSATARHPVTGSPSPEYQERADGQSAPPARLGRDQPGRLFSTVNENNSNNNSDNVTQNISRGTSPTDRSPAGPSAGSQSSSFSTDEEENSSSIRTTTSLTSTSPLVRIASTLTDTIRSSPPLVSLRRDQLRPERASIS